MIQRIEIPQSLRSFGMTTTHTQKGEEAENAATERLVYMDEPSVAAFSASSMGCRQRCHSDRREESRIINNEQLIMNNVTCHSSLVTKNK